MSVSFKDYYAVLGVDREASETEIKKAYRQKARELHPDVNQSPQAAEQFRDVNEAYEVLSDPEKRQRYDRLGSAWKHGAPFEPPPGFEGIHFDVGDLGDIFSGMRGAQHGDRTGFSDFFESLFGDLGVRFGGPFGESAARRPARGRDIEAEIEFVLGDLLAGGQRKITLGIPGPDGQIERRTVTVNVPRGVRPGQRLRLAGQGGRGPAGAPAGDIYLKIRLKHDPRLSLEGDDLITDLDVPAPVAVVGGEASIETPEGPVRVRIAPGSQAGRVLRVRGRGLPRKDGSRGDLKARIRLSVPRQPTTEEQELYERLASLAQQREDE